ncbi:MAG: hypothetical protein KGN34_07480 [Sphingomonadales bacterium]|nr:hypothetical protein [Sphingomonadales bacterium]
MATAKQAPLSRPPRRGWRFKLAWLLGALLFAGLALGWAQLSQRAHAAAAYGARVGCSCRLVAGRPLGDCRKDFENGMGLVWLSEDQAARSVTARFPLLATQTATFREGEGCVLEKWR